MKIYVLLALVAASSVHCEFEVGIYDRDGNDITCPSLPCTYRNVYAGDYIYCRFIGDTFAGRLQYGWIKEEDDDNEINEKGPNFISFPNEIDHSNRLYLGMTLGQGNPIIYRCVATDQDPYENLEELEGALVGFSVSPSPIAGQIFHERDYADVEGGQINLLCRRLDEDAQVVWETVSVDGSTVTVIYDSESGPAPSGNYELINYAEDSNDYTLRITMTSETAMLTRCSVTYNALTDVSSTAMLFKLDPVSSCEADNWEISNDAGTAITFSGCDFIAYLNPSSMIRDEITTITYWEEKVDDQFVPIDATRNIDGDSVHSIDATIETEGNVYRCTVEVYRETALAIRSQTTNVCGTGYTIGVTTDTVRHRVYYGDDEFIDFDALDRYKALEIAGASIECEVDSKPTVNVDNVIMQFKNPGSDEWELAADNTIPEDQVTVGAIYKCVYTDAGSNTYESGIVHIVQEVVDVEIYNAAGDLLEDGEEITLEEGEHVECRAVGDFSLDFPPRYIWYRSIAVENRKGPQMLRFPNTDENFNQLVVNYELGGGDSIGYRCIGIDILPDIGIPEYIGKLVVLTINESTSESVGTVFEPIDFAGYENNTVEWAATRASEDVHVVWEQVNEGGVVATIFDTDNEPESILDGYTLLTYEDEPLELGIQITVSQSTAIMTRVTISEQGSQTISSSAMVYMIGLVDACNADADLETDLPTGDVVTFSGCEVRVTLNPEAGNMGNTYSMMTMWQQNTEENQDYVTVERSRTIDGESILAEPALSAVNALMYTCAVQIHRENILVQPAIVNDMCNQDYQINVADNTVRYRIYHGVFNDMDPDDFIQFDETSSRYVTSNINNYNLTCEVDHHPGPVDNDLVHMEVRVAGQNQWAPDDENIIPYGEIDISSAYRCAYNDAQATPTESGEIHFATGFISVGIYNSAGDLLNEDDIYDISVGDYLECRPAETINTEYPPKYAWSYSVFTPNEAAGPNIIRYANTDDHYNRLVINSELGRGEVIYYRCIGADNLQVGLPDFQGTIVKFRAVLDTSEAGTVFEARDYLGIAGATVVLTGDRNNDQARVLWETVNVEGEPVSTIYDSDVGTDPDPESGYVLTGPGGFDLEVTISQDTAIFTRCTVSHNEMTDVSATTMIFLIEPSTCEESGLGEDPLQSGTEVTFSGCQVQVLVSSSAGEIADTYTTMTFWQMSDEVDGEYSIIDASRTLDGESVVVVPATMDSDNMYHTCGVQIHREEALVVPAVTHKVCADPYQILVEDNTVGFRIYHGTRDSMDDTDYIRFDSRDIHQADPFTYGDLTCEIDRKPAPGPEHEVLMQYLLPGEINWQHEGSNVILRDDLTVGTKYRCAYVEDGQQNEQSGIIYLMQGMAPVTIFNQDDEELNELDYYDVIPGEYLECRPAVDLYPEFRSQFVWHRSIQAPSYNGPRQLSYQNTEQGNNRLLITEALGQGEDIAYLCVCTDFLSDVPMVGLGGTLVRFRVLISDPTSAGIVFPPQEQIELVGQTIDLTCRRNNAPGHVIWETVNPDGEQIELIFDSDDSADPIPGYELVGGDSNIFDLRIDVTVQNALLTRCTVTEDGLGDASSTAMIYALERIPDTPCSADANGPVDVGDEIELSGCNAIIHVSDVSQVHPDDYEAVMYWEQQLEDEEIYTMVDESRALEAESVYDFEVLSPSHNSRMRCAIQISRPSILSSSNTINNICTDDITLLLKDNDIRFRIYYGERQNLDDDEFLDFTATAMNVGKTDNGDITCEVDGHPPPTAEDSWTMYERDGPQGDWNDLNEPIVPANQVDIGKHYKCVFNDNDGTSTDSLIMRMVEGSNDLTGVDIYNEDGELLTEGNVYSFNTNQYLECRPSDNSVVVPNYVWVKSIQYDAPGPNLIQNDNQMSGYNRLYLNGQFGLGADIAYRCIAGEDFGAGFQELLGTRVDFKMLFPGASDGGATSVHVSMACLLMAVVAAFYNF